MICDNEDQYINGEHPDFINKTVAFAPLEGEYYAADRMSVFNMVVSYTTGQPSVDWIKNNETLRQTKINGNSSYKFRWRR